MESNNIRLPELYNIAKSLGIQYIKKYNRLELINKIIDQQSQINNIFPFDDMLYEKPKKERMQRVKCDVCGEYIKESRMHSHKVRHNPEPDFILVDSVYKSRLLTYQHNNTEINVDIETYLFIYLFIDITSTGFKNPNYRGTFTKIIKHKIGNCQCIGNKL